MPKASFFKHWYTQTLMHIVTIILNVKNNLSEMLKIMLIITNLS